MIMKVSEVICDIVIYFIKFQKPGSPFISKAQLEIVTLPPNCEVSIGRICIFAPPSFSGES